MNSNKKVFFNGLNELRALAAFAVLFHHIELFKNRDKFASLYNSDFSYFISHLGKNGVYLFFVLSGFLITYLLLKEKGKNQTILFKKFYLRRIFRIWPLYYTIILIGFVLIPFLANTFNIFENVSYYFNLISNSNNYSGSSFLLYLFFLPNLALSSGKLVAGCSQTWSVGVEEQFYILWPLIIFAFTGKRIFRVFVVILFLILISNVFFQPAIFDRMTKIISFEISIIPRIYALVKIVPFEFMTIGALGGYMYAYYREQIVDLTKSKWLYLSLVALIFVFLYFEIIPKYFQNIAVSFLFLFLILISINDNNKSVFRNDFLSYLGSISYGIYMYHPFVLFLVFPFVNTYLKGYTMVYNLTVYIFVIGLTIALSHISYKYLELRFIKYKDKKFGSL